MKSIGRSDGCFTDTERDWDEMEWWQFVVSAGCLGCIVYWSRLLALYVGLRFNLQRFMSEGRRLQWFMAVGQYQLHKFNAPKEFRWRVFGFAFIVARAFVLWGLAGGSLAWLSVLLMRAVFGW